MYNSALKYYAKALLGRKNTMWYFDKLERSYSKGQQKIVRELLSRSVDELGFHPQAQKNPLYEVGSRLREECLSNYKNNFASSPYSVLIHLPPSSFSAGGNSLFYNMGESFKHLGIPVNYFWDELGSHHFDNSRINVMLTSFNDLYLKKIDWEAISSFRKKGRLLIGMTCPYNADALEEINPLIQKFLEKGDLFFYSFYAESFVKDSKLGKYIASLGGNVFPIEFAANPLFHFPGPYVSYDADYVFLGSSNYDKINRYYEYFYEVFKRFRGIVAGPGWKWTPDYGINPERDRLLYARAKVGLNLHLDVQIENPVELNERTYILAACGIPQVTDKPGLLDSYFKEVGFVARTAEEYVESISLILKNYDNALQVAEGALFQVYQKHTTFHRLSHFLKNFEKQIKV